MVRYFYAFVLTGLVLFSCGDNEPAPSLSSALLPELYEEADYSKRFIYNDKNQLTQIKMISTYANGTTSESVQNFFYGSDGLLKESTTDTGWKMVYYFSGGKITRTDEYVNGSLSQKHTYTYDQLGRLLHSITWQNIPEEGGEIPVAKDAYVYDNNNNVIMQRLYYYTSFGKEEKLLTVFTFSNYDNKINSEDYFDVHPFNPILKLRTNNPGKMVVENANGVVSSTETYSYEYHADGYPVKKVTNVLFYNGNSGSYQTTYRFRAN